MCYLLALGDSANCVTSQDPSNFHCKTVVMLTVIIPTSQCCRTAEIRYKHLHQHPGLVTCSVNISYYFSFNCQIFVYNLPEMYDYIFVAKFSALYHSALIPGLLQIVCGLSFHSLHVTTK